MGKELEEMYKFVRDRHDKLLAIRAMGQARLTQLLNITGLMAAGVTGLAIPQFAAIVKGDIGPSTVIAMPFIVASLAFLLLTVGMLLGFVLRSIGDAEISLPLTPAFKVLKIINDDGLTEPDVYRGLTKLYLQAIDKNERNSQKIANRIKSALYCLTTSLVALLIFIGVLVTAYATSHKPDNKDTTSKEPTMSHEPPSNDPKGETPSNNQVQPEKAPDPKPVTNDISDLQKEIEDLGVGNIIMAIERRDDLC